MKRYLRQWQEVHATGDLPIPTHLQDAHYKGAAKLGHGTGYKYAHDYPNDMWNNSICRMTEWQRVLPAIRQRL